MTPEHQSLLMELASRGRLGPFALWPRPAGWPEEGQIVPRVLRDTPYGPKEVLPDYDRMGPPARYDPDFPTRNWTILGGTPNDGCPEMPACPDGYCTGDPACPWHHRTLTAARRRLEHEYREEPMRPTDCPECRTAFLDDDDMQTEVQAEATKHGAGSALALVDEKLERYHAHGHDRAFL